ncbi:unnamed protein product [Allacma fusca]|uniref:Uncharacterized protein n=1 Tax=Allacma fusca TaxID=39272 RepID=A0A8J2KXK2_9HEXA|nr:unnamed protein product [Allacma fusca]
MLKLREVDRNTGKIQVQTQRWRKFLFYFHYAYSILQILFYIATWILQLVYPKMMRVRDFPMHCVVIAAFVMLFSWSTSLYLVWPETTVLIFNEMFSYEDRQKKQNREYSKDKMNWKSYSLQELFVIIAPCTLYGATFVGGFVFLLKPKRIFTLFTLVQKLGFEHKYLYAASTGVDIFLLSFPTSVSAVGIFFQVLFFLRVFSLVEEKIQNLE